MFSVVQCSAVFGVDAYLVRVEADVAGGSIPSLSVVGLPDAAVQEARERVRAAIRNAGFEFPLRRITVNLAPADVRKEGSAFDLAIALAILASSEQIRIGDAETILVLGELSLDGTVRPVRGAVAIAADARTHGVTSMIVPRENAEEAAVIDGVSVYGVGSLLEAATVIANPVAAAVDVDLDALFLDANRDLPDLADVKGQEHAKRALEVAAVGGHNLLMMGPPGSGKTMLARRLPSILPRMTLDEAFETTKIHSVAGALAKDAPLVTSRPFRDPHHTVSMAGLVGGGKTPGPGEVSLAHHGVLFLDELPEFPRNALESLRQPLENGTATIARAWGSLTFPARTMLVAAMNPCPCGYLGDGRRACRCNPALIQRYHAKISGPLLDRIDLHVEVPAVPFEQLRDDRISESSADVRHRVQRARDAQRRRFTGTRVYTNAMMGPRQVREHCKLDGDAMELLAAAMERLLLSARGHDRILKVARSIADLDDSEGIQLPHIAEAIQYRSLDRLIRD